jgi:hypothetical protein
MWEEPVKLSSGYAVDCQDYPLSGHPIRYRFLLGTAIILPAERPGAFRRLHPRFPRGIAAPGSSHCTLGRKRACLHLVAIQNPSHGIVGR